MNVIILCVFGFLILLFPVLSYLIVKHKRNVISLNTHFSDFSTGLKSFLNSPIWGHGIGNYKESFVNFGGGNGQTSGLISVAAQGGLLLLILYLLPLLRLIVIGLSEKKWGWTAYSVIIIGMFLVVVIDNNPLFAVILAFCYSIPNDSKIVLNPSWGKHKLETSKVHK
ncbi:hypothetical protein OZX74_01590 [Bifidobacterium sp. ESL0798]|uniref:hypothetical protein n=1 Tax=Bifidobacterium sp. ESL0798 TaxID=2983235 RepID=UPI0023F65489|nr:hypothetical protein [Bifidobacterium sp. ESL0798]WEV74278.1 hypothetical protein OZX74_01590 [Bifidobacterium sp. ESL0798]